MAYIPLPVKTLRTGKHCLTLPTPGGGLEREDASFEAGELFEADNMLLAGHRLYTRPALSTLCRVTGTFRSILSKPFGGVILFHAGGAIYAFDGEDATLISSLLPDAPSLAFTMNGRAWFFSEEKVIVSVGEDLTARRETPYVPVIVSFEDSFGHGMQVIEPVNRLTKKVRVRHIADSSVDVYCPAYDFKSAEPADLWYNGRLLHANILKDRFGFAVDAEREGIPDGNEFEIEYTVSDAETVFDDNLSKVFGSTLAVCFGGSAGEGSRVFVSGNTAYPGSLFRSDLKNPLYFPDDAEETVGDGTANVTALLCRYDKLCVFTKEALYAVSYRFDTENGASFPVTLLSGEWGCARPGSEAVIDNAPVFAAEDGLHILCSTAVPDEEILRPLGAGLFPDGVFPGTSGGAFPSVDFGRRYYLACPEEVLVWDYGRTPYYDTGDYAASQRRLSWYRLTGFGTVVAFCPLNGVLSYLKADGDDLVIVSMGGDGSDEAMTSGFVTGDTDGNIPNSFKKLTSLTFTLHTAGSGSLDVTVYGDGAPLYTHTVSFTAASPKNGRVRLTLPPARADRFRFGFACTGGFFGVENLSAVFVPSDRMAAYAEPATEPDNES